MARRIVITGMSGFVARVFMDHLKNGINTRKDGDDKDVSVLGLDIVEPVYDLKEYRDTGIDVKFIRADLMDQELVSRVIGNYEPTEILHLAAFSSVTYSWEHPADCFSNNTKVFLTIEEAVRNAGIKCRILSVGSSEIYGDVTEDMLPLREDMPVSPLSPYSIARQAQEQLAKVFVDRFDMDIILTRSFNHIGPRQDARFVVPSFISRILKERGNLGNENKSADTADTRPEVTIETGNTSIIRDFLDVRDVVRAYDLLLRKGKSGEIYNISGNKGISLAQLIDEIGDIVGVRVNTVVNPDFVRPSDTHRIIGDYTKIRADVGWEPQISLRQTLEDMVDYMSASHH